MTKQSRTSVKQQRPQTIGYEALCFVPATITACCERAQGVGAKHNTGKPLEPESIQSDDHHSIGPKS
jgi:hypothetical protein